jgi:hypothetical protein
MQTICFVLVHVCSTRIHKVRSILIAVCVVTNLADRDTCIFRESLALDPWFCARDEMKASWAAWWIDALLTAATHTTITTLA